MKANNLTESQIEILCKAFSYNPVTGIITKIKQTEGKRSLGTKFGVHLSPTAGVKLPDGKKLSMPTPRLAYVLHHKANPKGRVYLREKPQGPNDPMNLRPENVRDSNA